MWSSPADDDDEDCNVSFLNCGQFPGLLLQIVFVGQWCSLAVSEISIEFNNFQMKFHMLMQIGKAHYFQLIPLIVTPILKCERLSRFWQSSSPHKKGSVFILKDLYWTMIQYTCFNFKTCCSPNIASWLRLWGFGVALSAEAEAGQFCTDRVCRKGHKHVRKSCPRWDSNPRPHD